MNIIAIILIIIAVAVCAFFIYLPYTLPVLVVLLLLRHLIRSICLKKHEDVEQNEIERASKYERGYGLSDPQLVAFKRVMEEDNRRYDEQLDRELKEIEDSLLESDRVSEMRKIFSSSPWSDIWGSLNLERPDFARRITRANEQDMKVLSYSATDETARIQGSRGRIYTTSSNFCDCPDFEERNLPCKHMFKLALVLQNGFNNETHVGESHTVLSTAEQEREAFKKSLIRRIPHRHIIEYVRAAGPVTRSDIASNLPRYDKSAIQRATIELYNNGIIQGEKRSGRYYHWVEEEKPPADSDEQSI